MYAEENEQMKDGHGCDSDRQYMAKYPSRNEKEFFEGGIVNGANWYEIDGGLQDWNYWNMSVFEVTIELESVK